MRNDDRNAEYEKKNQEAGNKKGKNWGENVEFIFNFYFLFTHFSAGIQLWIP